MVRAVYREERKIAENILANRKTVETICSEARSYDPNSKSRTGNQELLNSVCHIMHSANLEIGELRKLTKGDAPSQTTIECEAIAQKANMAYRTLVKIIRRQEEQEETCAFDNTVEENHYTYKKIFNKYMRSKNSAEREHLIRVLDDLMETATDLQNKKNRGEY